MLKNIFLVSYLKNKGIRRICCVLGVLLSAYSIIISPKIYDNNTIDKEYINYKDMKIWFETYYEVNPLKALTLAECSDTYFSNLGISDSKYVLYGTGDPVEFYCSVSEKRSCDLFRILADEKIPLNCGKPQFFLTRPIVIFLSFYLPFILVLLLKLIWQIFLWVYKGFKEYSK